MEIPKIVIECTGALCNFTGVCRWCDGYLFLVPYDIQYKPPACQVCVCVVLLGIVELQHKQTEGHTLCTLDSLPLAELF